MINLELLGAGALAKDILACFSEHINFTGVWDDALDSGSMWMDLPVRGALSEVKALDPTTHFVLALGNPALRQQWNTYWLDKLNWATLIHPEARIFSSGRCSIGSGSILFPGAYLTSGVSVGRHCILHIHSGLHHDVRLGDCSVLMPGSKISCTAEIPPCFKLDTNAAITSPAQLSA